MKSFDMDRVRTGTLRLGVVCYPSLGGSGVIATSLACGLAERGHEVHLISTAPPTRPETQHPQLHFHPVEITEYPLYPHSNYTVAVAAAIVKLTESHSIDLLHLHYAVPHAASAMLVRAILRDALPATAITLHGSDVMLAQNDFSAPIITRFAVEAADLLTVPSAFLQKEAYARLGISRRHEISVIPNFVDVERFQPLTPMQPRQTDAPIQLVHVSNLRPVKRPLDLIEVFERVRRKKPAHLRIIGDGPCLQRLQDVVTERNLSEHVEILGRVADPRRLVADADVFLFPSASESFGVAALEAMALGVPVVAYAVGGLPEVVTTDAGQLVAPYDEEAMACAVLALTEDPQRHLASREAARRRAVAEFSGRPAFDRYEALFLALMDSIP